MSCAWKNPKCRIGLIIGTGTNACYLEDIDEVIQVLDKSSTVNAVLKIKKFTLT